MSSKKLETHEVEISWGNIEDQIASLLYATKKIKDKMEIVAIKFSPPVDLLAREKKLTLQVTTKRGAEVRKFNGQKETGI